MSRLKEQRRLDCNQHKRGNEDMRGRIMFLVVVLAASVGCQMGQFSLKLNHDHVIPLPEVNVLPEQWEPEPLED
jgi:hypothetical protein